MLDLDAHRAVVAPRDAATLLLVRDGGVPAPRLEIFCVVRHLKSGFLGGAVVFPGGKVDPTDRDEAWAASAVGVPRFGADEEEATARAFGIAVCREALEEAAILLTAGPPLAHDEVLALRAALAKESGKLLRTALAEHTPPLALDLAALRPFGRWVTPTAESRRFDTRFFLACAPRGQDGAHDAHETTASFWATPSEVLRRFDAGELQLAPPTHRCLELLAAVTSTAEALGLASTLGVEPICPRLITIAEGAEGGASTMALVLPGDPSHELPEARVPGASRFVLHGERWLPATPTVR